jgi:P-type Ca2+ transporter type 2C
VAEFHNLSIEEVTQTLGTNIHEGLSEDTEDLRKRIEKYGENKFEPPKQESFIKKVIGNLKDPIISILLFFCIISIAIKEYKDGFGIAIAILLSTSISLYMEGKGSKALEALNALASNIQVKVTRCGIPKQIYSETLVVGDIIHLEPGNKVPADARLISVYDLKVEESGLTGESLAVTKTIEPLEGEIPLAEQTNMVRSGSFVQEGRGIAIVTAVGDKTEIGKIATALRETVTTATPLQEKLEAFGKNISSVCTALAGLLLCIQCYQLYQLGTLNFISFKAALVTSIALIVAAVPEGLPTMIALTLSFNTVKMQRQNALVKKLIACETIGSIDIICSDKTGTLTQNKMKVVSVWAEGKFQEGVTFVCGDMHRNMITNSTAELGTDEKVIGNPTEGALLLNAKDNDLDYAAIRAHETVLKTLDFSSARKMMTTVVREETGDMVVLTKGAPERVLAASKFYRKGEEVLPLTPDIIAIIELGIKTLQDRAQRVLGFAYKNVDKLEAEPLESELIFTGFVGIEDPVRPDVKAAIEKCAGAGIRVMMLTGDNISTARAIAGQLGMLNNDSLVLEAKDVEKLDKLALAKILHKVVVIARSTPTTKKMIVDTLKEMGRSVAVTGDGVNDSIALKAADVGISMGITGTETAKEASDMVLLDDSFSTIATAIKWGRGIFENFQRFITFQLTVNVVAFLTAFAATIMGLGLPFTTLQLLWVNVIMDGPPALSLGMEPPRNELMDRNPVKRNASIITGNMLFRIVTSGVFITISLLALMKYQLLGGTPEMQKSIVFSVFVFFQLWNAFNCREFGTDSVFPNFFKNKAALGLIGGAALVQILLVQFAGSIFNTVPLPLEMWGIIIVATFSIILFSEFLKLILGLVLKINPAPREIS